MRTSDDGCGPMRASGPTKVQTCRLTMHGGLTRRIRIVRYRADTRSGPTDVLKASGSPLKRKKPRRVFRAPEHRSHASLLALTHERTHLRDSWYRNVGSAGTRLACESRSGPTLCRSIYNDVFICRGGLWPSFVFQQRFFCLNSYGCFNLKSSVVSPFSVMNKFTESPKLWNVHSPLSLLM